MEYKSEEDKEYEELRRLPFSARIKHFIRAAKTDRDGSFRDNAYGCLLFIVIPFLCWILFRSC